MSTFYLVPPRRFLAEHLASYLNGLFPGLNWTGPNSSELVEALDGVISEHSDVYVVHREDLPQIPDLGLALAEAFGAENGDRVIEVEIGAGASKPTTRSWQVGSSR